MRLSCMQPYLFPYLGYFQLIHATDLFIVRDDVQYIKRGWINRNHLLINGKTVWFTFSLKKDSSRLLINERYFIDDIKHVKDNFQGMLLHYTKAPYYEETSNLIKSLLAFDEKNISKFITHCLKGVCKYLNIKTHFLVASELTRDSSLKGEQAVLELNILLNANHYINAIGGIELYSPEKFAQHGIKLNFIKMNPIIYQQFKDVFVPNLSIIDVLMFNSRDEVKDLLNEYILV